jgi:hypothetical protein
VVKKKSKAKPVVNATKTTSVVTKKKASKPVRKVTKKKLTKAKGVVAKKATKVAKKAVPMKMGTEAVTAHEYLRMLASDPDALYNNAVLVKKKYEKELMRIPGVLCVDVGVKVQKGMATHEFAICICVKEKSELTSLPPNQRIAEFYDGIPTDVQCVRFIPASAGGDKISPGGSVFGTLAVGVQTLTGLKERYLTCAHVISPIAPHSISSVAKVFDAVTANMIGTVGTKKGTDWEFTSQLDCALIQPTSPQSPPIKIPPGLTHFNPNRMRRTKPSDMAGQVMVWKYGCSTNFTQGKIVSIDASAPLVDGTITINQIKIISDGNGPFAVDGDSGSLVCIGNDAIGVLRAISLDKTYTICSPLRTADQKGAADIMKFIL